MSQSFTIRPAMSVLRNEDFAATSSLTAATQRRLISDQFSGVQCGTTAEVVGDGVRLRFTSRVEGVQRETAVVHKFFFIERSETRERAHLVTPEDSECTTELLVAFAEEQEKDYFNASVYDNDGRIIATDSIVFNNQGKIVPYPFVDKYVSPLELGDASLTEARDAEGRRVARFQIQLTGLEADESVYLLWEAMGIIHREERVCTPDSPVAALDLVLDDNPAVVACDWIAIAVDAQERVIAQTSFALVPRS